MTLESIFVQYFVLLLPDLQLLLVGLVGFEFLEDIILLVVCY